MIRYVDPVNLHLSPKSSIYFCCFIQNINSVENLELPYLRELYLHRNNIASIDTLSHCPRIKKLWLFQNNLTNIYFLQSLIELEECWLQCNFINSLIPFSTSCSLICLNIASNPIDSLIEVKHLCHHNKLKYLIFYDIHFGKCNIVNEDGYRNYIILLLRQLQQLDGVMIKREHLIQAEEEYYNQVYIHKMLSLVVFIFIGMGGWDVFRSEVSMILCMRSKIPIRSPFARLTSNIR